MDTLTKNYFIKLKVALFIIQQYKRYFIARVEQNFSSLRLALLGKHGDIQVNEYPRS